MKSSILSRLAGRGGRRFLGTVALVATVAAPAAAGLSFIFPSWSKPLNKSYSTHAANWWKWALTQPAATNPVTDTTGEFCGQGQSGSVFYLAGSFGTDPVSRKCTVPFGRTLVFPVINGAYFAFLDDPEAERTEEFVRSKVDYVSEATNLSAQVDGIDVPFVKRWYEESDLFSVTLPEGNIYGLPAGFEFSPAADAGYYLAVSPLTLGKHTIRFKGEVPGFSQDITYELTVK